METINLEKSIKDIFNGQYKYIIPLYQRNFAWRREQIEQLLQDIYEAFKNEKKGYYFIGSLVVLKRPNGDYEVIDGQQRLTTLSLITKILGINEEPRLFYDSRPEVEEFFQEFYKPNDGKYDIDNSQTFHLRNAIQHIKETHLDAKNNAITIDSVTDEFKAYFANNVILVRVEIPQDTDVASYFEIMNNRGEQLQKHEILKSIMLGRIQDYHKQKEFALIWDACSQMDIPIQKSFKVGDTNSVGTRNYYFGNDYNNFRFESLAEISQTVCTQNDKNDIDNDKDYSIDTIIGDKSIVADSFGDNNIDDEQFESDSEYKSIIDFPNFLMHVLKVICQKEDIPLNERYLLSEYNRFEDEIKPEDFIKKLLFCRTVFDRYIIKTIADEKDNEDGEKWALIKPKKYEKSWKYVDTFEKDIKGDKTTKEQERIVKALSMLQVTFRTRIYKNWLYEILNWFTNENKKITASFDEYIITLDNIILNNYKGLYNDKKEVFSQKTENASINKENSYSLGTKTPHFLFNLIDYLYWVDSKNEVSIFNPKKELKGFEFKYWNSVEHHMAKEWAKRNNVPQFEEFIDNLGNLCLISKNANSRLSDRDVKEKVETFGKGILGANRQIMYNMTKNDDNTYTWNEIKIKAHYNELLELLSKRDEILKHKKE